MPFRYRAAFQYVMINDFLSISSTACADKETIQHLRSYHFKQLTRIIRAAQSITWSTLDFDCLNYTYAPRISPCPGKQTYMPSVKYAHNGAPELRASLIASCPMWVLYLQAFNEEAGSLFKDNDIVRPPVLRKREDSGVSLHFA